MPSWMISSLFELGKLLKVWNSSHGMPSGEDRDDAINKQLKTRNVLSRAQAGLSRSFKTLCPARYSRCLATETCRDLISYIRIVYLKKFP
jgi:hypothetical protein